MVENKPSRMLGRPRTFNPEDALQNITNVFWELGYDAADTETLSKKTGFSKPSLYRAFGAKEDIFVAALKHYQQTRSQASLNALTNAASPFEGIRDFFVCFAQNVAGAGHPRGCLVLSIALPLRDRLPKVSAFLDQSPKEAMSGMTTYFKQQIEAGRLPSHFDLSLIHI